MHECSIEVGPQHAPPVPRELSCRPGKRALLGVDSYFRDSWEDGLRVAGEGLAALLHRHAAVLLKPDAVVARRLGAAIEWLEQRGFEVVAAARCRVDRHVARALWLWQWNIATRDRRDLADRMLSSGDSLYLVLRAGDGPVPASVRLSDLKGPGDPELRAPGQLRRDIGNFPYLLNLVHCADEPVDVVRELGILVDGAERERLYAAIARGEPAREHALELAAALEAAAPAHPLRLEAALRSIEARLAGLADAGEARELRELLALARAGRYRDWREIAARAARAGAPLERWDEIVLGAHLMEPTAATGIAVVAAVTEADWIAATAPPAPRTAARSGAPR